MTTQAIPAKRRSLTIALALGLLLGTASPSTARFPATAVPRCGSDAVLAGTVCLDTYEASVWRVPNPTTTNLGLVRKIQQGKATRADLAAGGARQLGMVLDDYTPCARNGEHCAEDVYAVSLPSVLPSAFVTWFQAQEACANSGKRLPTSAEWQVGANGTPDPGEDNGSTDCNSNSGAVDTAPLSLTGARSSCASARGAFDMVGNLGEWVADWQPAGTSCPGWASFSTDQMCLAGASTTRHTPGALVRGGWFFSGPAAGPLAVVERAPFSATNFIGFRCAR